MHLYFLRHGHAEDGGGAVNDFDRALTEHGIARLKHAAAVIARLNLKLDHVFSSPRVRARQTAQIIAEPLGLPVTIHKALNFGFNVEALPDLLADVSPEGSVMFVGHEPTFSMTVQALTGAAITMRKGGLAYVLLNSLTPPLGTLEWLIAPKVFDAINEAH